MSKFSFSKEDYLRKVDEALNTPIEKLTPNKTNPKEGIKRLLEAAKSRREPVK